MFEVNYLAIVVAALANWIFGALYYSPIMLGKAWMKEMGITPEILKKNKEEGKSAGLSYFLGFLSILVTAYFLAVFINLGVAYMDRSIITDAILTSVLAWAGFIVTSIFGQVQWEGKSYKLFLINILYQGVGFVIMGAIIGAWMG